MSVSTAVDHVAQSTYANEHSGTSQAERLPDRVCRTESNRFTIASKHLRKGSEELGQTSIRVCHLMRPRSKRASLQPSC